MDGAALKQRAERLFKSFAPAQLAIIGLLTVGIAIGAMTFMHWASAPSYSVLFSGLDSKDASEVVAKLKSQGVPYKLVGDGSTVTVPASKVYDLRLAMSSAGLPKGGVVGYEILDKQGLTSSEFSQQVGYQRALEGELTRTLMAMHGMQAVTVHLGIPQDNLFSDNSQQPRASVLVKTASPMDYDTVDSIVHLVASSVPGLQPDAVTVADTNGHVLSSDGNTGAGSTRDIQTTQQYESDLAANASAMLAQVYGPGHAVVRVSARMNFDNTERQTDTYDPKTTTPLREQTSSETYKAGDGSTATGTSTAGALGTTATTPATGTGSNSTDYQKSDGSKEYGVNHITETSKVAPGKVERLSVAVVLDGSAKPAPDAEKVKQVVGAALGLDATRGDNIVVDTMRFDGANAAAGKSGKAGGGASAGGAAGAGGTGTIVDYARTGLGAILVMAVLVVFLRRLRRTKVELVDVPALGPGSVATALSRAGGSAGVAGGMPPAAIPVPSADSSSHELVPVGVGGRSDDLLRMVDQQPDEVAVLLRSWLGDRRT